MRSGDCKVYSRHWAPCQLCLGPGPGNTSTARWQNRTEHTSKVARFLYVWSLEQVKVELDLILLWTREKKVKKFKRKNVSRNIFIVESFHLHINLYLFIFRIISIRLTSQPNGSPIKSISFSFGQSPTNVKIKVGRFYIWCWLGSSALTCSDFLTKFSTAILVASGFYPRILQKYFS